MKKIMRQLRKYFKKKRKSGFTMIELLIAIAIIAGLAALFTFGVSAALQKSRDATRKKDLEKIKIAFEDYYNDNRCYPETEVLANCGSRDFQPYLNSVPCDPLTKEPYYLVSLANQCAGYRVLAGLENKKDAVIAELGCDGDEGCGWGEEFNYGIAAGTTVAGSGETTGGEAGGVGEGTGGGIVFVYACDSAGTCNRYQEGHPALNRCPVTFPNPGCAGQCGNPSYWCE